jgi:Fe-Mn family superoxide dismutase
MIEAIPLDYSELPGLSARALADHHDKLYVGYVSKTNAIREELKAVNRADANGTYAAFRELKLEEGFALNGVKLHEAYFASMSLSPTGPSDLLAEWLAADFGSVEAWAADFYAVAMAARGWAVLAFDYRDGKLRNFLCDMHNQGGIWGAIPLIVMDVYEHAYVLDHSVARKSYLDRIMPALDWTAANDAVAKHDLEKHRAD